MHIEYEVRVLEIDALELVKKLEKLGVKGLEVGIIVGMFMM